LLGRICSWALAAIVAASALTLGVIACGTGVGQWRMAPVLTGSMEPHVPQGALVVSEKVAVRDLRPGDVMLFRPPIAGHPLVVHRIYDRRPGPDGPIFHTKGDANNTPDPWTIRVEGSVAWRAAFVVPHVGTAIGVLSRGGARMAVLVFGVLLLLVCGLRALWALRPISWHADDPHGLERRRRQRRATRRALGVLVAGGVLVGALATTGFANAKFTNTPASPTPSFGSGQLPTPTGLGCRWASATTLTTSWTAVAAGFATGYDIRRGDASGGPYSSIGSASPLSTVTFTDTAPGPPTLRYYVVAASKGTWISALSNQVVSNQCTAAVNLVAGTSAGFSGDTGLATSAQLNTPRGIAVDSSGNIYIADTTNNRIRKVDATTGVITTIAGGGASTACTFNGAATSVSLSGPRGVAVDGSGNVYIADTGRNCVRKVVGTTVSQVAGGGASTACTFNGAATSVSLSAPGGVAVDSSGTVYIADTGRNCVRKVVGTTVSQVAGGGASTACTFSGAATSVSLSAPGGVAVDSSGNVYIADTSRNCIRKVVGTTVSQVAGGGATTTCGTVAVGSVSLSAPAGVAVDSSGRVVIADGGRNCVRMVSGTNVVQVAGTAGTAGSTGDNGPAAGALTTTPSAIAANTSGDLWFADAGTHRVRRVEGPL
jgi:signal peptidase I